MPDLPSTTGWLPRRILALAALGAWTPWLLLFLLSGGRAVVYWGMPVGGFFPWFLAEKTFLGPGAWAWGGVVLPVFLLLAVALAGASFFVLRRCSFSGAIFLGGWLAASSLSGLLFLLFHLV